MSYRATVWTDKRHSRLFATVEEAVEWVKAETSDNRKRLIEYVSDVTSEEVVDALQSGYPPSPPPDDDPVAKRLGMIEGTQGGT